MILELSNGAKIDDPSEEQIIAALLTLDGQENSTLTLKDGLKSALRVERHIKPRYYFYYRRLSKQYQSLQPLSENLAKKVLLEFNSGKRSWKKALSFRALEPRDDEPYDPAKIGELSDKELKTQVDQSKAYMWLLPMLGVLLATPIFFLVRNFGGLDFQGGLQLAGIAASFIVGVVYFIRWRLDLNREVSRRRHGDGSIPE